MRQSMKIHDHSKNTSLKVIGSLKVHVKAKKKKSLSY
jgi:hypothetical protein